MSLETSILLTTLIVTLLMFALVWLLHIRQMDVGIIDIYWGPGFAVIALLSYILHGEHSPFGIILLITTMAWSLRLGTHLWLRHKKSTTEDRRYALMRKNAGPSFWWTNLFKIFFLQAIIMWLIATPQHLGLLYADTPLTFSAQLLFYAGIGLFIFGFLIESIADWQLRRFKSKQENRQRTMSEGLWAYSRHPNYFGEVVLWWGFALMGFALSNSLIAFAGPALLTFLILKVSGVTLLEKYLTSDKQGYSDYIKKTSAFFPAPSNNKAHK